MNDDELRQAMATMDAYKAQLEALTQQSQFFQLSIEEIMRAHSTLKAFVDAKEGDEILVPAGASSFVVATVTGKRTAVVGIGNKTSVEMDLEDAAEYMSVNLKEVTEAQKKLSASVQDMNAKAQNLAMAIQQEYQRRQQ